MKITINDLLLTKNQDCIFESKRTEKDDIYYLNKQEFKDYMIASKNRPVEAKKSFFELVPSTELEKSINEVLKKKSIDFTEKRKERNYITEFDKKMQRIKKIKSKKYRKLRRRDRIRNNETNEAAEPNELENADLNEAIEKNVLKTKSNIPAKLLKKIEPSENNLESLNSNKILSYRGSEKKDDTENQEMLVKLAFNDCLKKDEVEEEFEREKEAEIIKDCPKTEETVLPGWGEWSGAGLKTEKTKINTVKRKIDGIKYSNRKDFKMNHVIYNEKIKGIDNKYKIDLPYGYTKDEYLAKINVPVSKEWNTLRIFNKFVKPEDENVEGKPVEPFIYEPKN